MTLTIIDIITSILQAFIFTYVISYCTSKENNTSKLKLISIAIMFIIEGNIFSGTFGNNPGVSIIITHILALCTVAIFYRKNIIAAITSHTIIYSIVVMYSIVFGNLIFEYANQYLNKFNILKITNEFVLNNLSY